MNKLTRRELETLQLIATGLTNQEICEELTIGISTVKKYVQHIFGHLDVGNRETAVRTALRRNLIERNTGQVKNNLHQPVTPCIGRDQELKLLDKLTCSPDSRLITILGMGGIGKSRLALEMARGYGLDRKRFTDGIFQLPLSADTPISKLITSIITIVNSQVPLIGSEATGTAQLYHALADKKMLFVFENIEQLPAARNIIQQILITSPHVKIVTTSQSKLDVYGEHILPLKGLPCSSKDPNKPSPAAELFYKATQQHICLHPTPNDAVIVNKICEAVSGHPLAIELAAAQLSALSLAQILSELKNPLNFLEARQLGRAQRHMSMRATCSYMWHHLTREEKDLLLKCLENDTNTMAQEVMVEGRHHMTALLGLINKSVLHPLDENWFKIHPLLHQFALEQSEKFRKQNQNIVLHPPSVYQPHVAQDVWMTSVGNAHGQISRPPF
ncbi:MAG: LuxR C-terminal-related transcriptional regulator [Chloroflexota bacterium]